MNPKKITIFLVGVLLTLWGITFFSGEYRTADGAVKQGILFGDTMLKFPTSNVLSQSNHQTVNAKASEILKDIANAKQERKNRKEKPQVVHNEQVTDSSEVKKEEPILNTNVEGKIYYPENRIEFIKELKERLTQKKCHIIHYGDSQIEGDRITVYLRNRFQSLYGGNGPGFIPVKIAYTQNSVSISSSSNWLRFASFDRHNRKKVPHKKYGIFTTLSRFTDYTKQATPQTAEFTIKPSTKAYNRLRKYSKFGLHYGNCTEPTKISVFINGNLFKEDELVADGNYHNFKLSFSQTPSEIKVVLESALSPDFYGITLDDNEGVSMDNVAMRGESGRIFTRNDFENFRQMASERKTDIFIFQFGGNNVPYLRKDKQITDYMESLLNNIHWVKRCNPKALFIVIGPGDMSTSVGGKMMTYPFLIKLNERMKEECTKNGVAFWSIYEAMGGENSMVEWVKSNMANADYVHLKPKGTQVISELFFECLYNDILAIN